LQIYLSAWSVTAHSQKEEEGKGDICSGRKFKGILKTFSGILITMELLKSGLSIKKTIKASLESLSENIGNHFMRLRKGRGMSQSIQVIISYKYVPILLNNSYLDSGL
jgi:hypothetical protein